MVYSVVELNDIDIRNTYGFIYMTTNNVNQKKYIGRKTFDTASRWKSYLGSGTYLANAIKTYGKENFSREILDVSQSNEELDDKEKYWISYFNAVESDDYYNQIDGGSIIDHNNKMNDYACVCIVTGFVFKNLTEASKWSHQNVETIRKYKGTSYIKNKNVNDRLLFKMLKDIPAGKYPCSCCGKGFLRKGRNKKCNKCIESNVKIELNIKFDYKKKPSNTFYMNDLWVVDWYMKHDSNIDFEYFSRYFNWDANYKKTRLGYINRLHDNIIQQHLKEILELKEKSISYITMPTILNLKVNYRRIKYNVDKFNKGE